MGSSAASIRWKSPQVELNKADKESYRDVHTVALKAKTAPTPTGATTPSYCMCTATAP